jgi:hypothetical protein
LGGRSGSGGSEGFCGTPEGVPFRHEVLLG